jgi:4-hydroxy-3-methylbut-2-en-1-yl diphosphate reductase
MATRHRTGPGCLVLCALPPEAMAAWVGLQLFELRSRASRPAVGGGAPRCRVRLTGMGPKRARRAFSQLASSVPDGLPVVVVGVGGALVEGFEAGDLVVASQFGTADAGPGGELRVTRPPVALDERSRAFAGQLLESLSARFPSTTFAPLLSAGRTARGQERAVLASSGAVICDTESVWLARLADRRPFAVVRAVVDAPERELVSLKTVTGGALGLSRLTSAAQVIAEVVGARAAHIAEDRVSSPEP